MPMRLNLLVAGVITFIVVAILAGDLVLKAAPSIGPIPLNCNRACLENLVDQYLTALVAHDPKRLPLSKDVMYTENDQVMEIGDGFWKTVEGLATTPTFLPTRSLRKSRTWEQCAKPAGLY